MQEVHKKLGKCDADLRRKKGFSQKVCVRVRLPPKLYEASSGARKNIALAMTNKIARTLKITLSELFKGV